MRVQIWLRDDLTRRTDGRPPQHRFVAGWDDARSASREEAAERAWRVCSRAPHTLTSEEQEWRAAFEQMALGYGLSVGDIVVVDGTPLRCLSKGFSTTEMPSPPSGG